MGRTSRRQRRTLLTAAALAAMAASGHAATWTGGAGTGNWGDAANWDGNVPNAAGDTAIFRGDGGGQTAIDAGAGKTVQFFTIDQPGATTASFTFSGLITLSGGTNVLSVANDVSSSHVFDANLFIQNSTQLRNDGTGTLTFNGTISTPTTGARTLSLQGSGNGFINGEIIRNGTSSLAVQKTGAGTWVIAARSGASLAGNVSAGTLVVAANEALGEPTTGTTVANNATLGFQGDINYTPAELTTITGTGAVTRSGAIDNISGANTYAGVITLAAAAQIGATAGSLHLTGGITTASGIDLTVNAAGGDVQVSTNPIAGAGKLNKIGAGTLTLAGGNTYSGGTNVTAGTLAVTNTTGSATGSGGVTLTGSTASLSGSGIIAGSVLATGGAAITPGNSVGTLTAGGLSLDGGGQLVIDVDLSGPTPVADQLVINGDVALTGGALQLNIIGGLIGGADPITITLIDKTTAGAIVGDFSVPGGGGLVQYSTSTTGGDGNDFTITFTSVPEPGLAGLLAAAAGLGRRRRRLTR